MKKFLPSLDALAHELARLPGIGPKAAQRMGFFLLQDSAEDPQRLAGLLTDLRKKAVFCRICGVWTEENPCWICDGNSRDHAEICVVQGMNELLAIEKAGTYQGTYHVLKGLLSPLDGKGPETLSVEELLSRVSQGEIREVILALDPTLEGEATTRYLSLRLRNMKVRVTRIASGVPVGGDLAYVDELTLSRSMLDRREVEVESDDQG